MAFINLDGEWLVKGYPAGGVSADEVLAESGSEEGWLPAQVPGEIHLDLQRNGAIPDPFYRDNEEKTQWVHWRDWWFRRGFFVDPQLLDEDRVELVCEGLDTFAVIFLNGQPVATTDNMVRTFRFDARPYLRGGDNELVIGFHAPHAACHELATQHGHHRGGFNFADIVQVRKSQYSCGWDWGPFVTSIGIWRPVRVESWSVARIDNVCVRATEITDARATVEVQVALQATSALPVTVSVNLSEFVGDTLRTEAADLTLAPGDNIATVILTIDQPRRWWPVGYGEQARYRAEIEVAGEGFTAYRTVPFGLRTVELIRQPDVEGESFIVAINGTPIFCKGANWIPGDQFLPRVTDAYYRKNLELAVQAGMNMIRVWGGGIYETETFYHLCDELGLMVWQDFLFACGSYPEHEAFRENFIAEATQAIRDLRNYPSLVLWCGNNENHWLFPPTNSTGYVYYDEILPRLCAEMDPTRPYWNGSPYGKEGEAPNAATSGDRHAWDVWGGGTNHDWTYLFDRGKFISEFGMQAPPTMPTLESFTAPEDRKPWSRVMEIHEKMPDKHVRLYAYLAMHFPVPADLRWWVYASQANQCLILNRSIAHWRARKWLTAGTLFWQLNDCWPVTSWAVIDYQCRPKPGWYEARRLYQPVFLTIEPVIPPEVTNQWAMLLRDTWQLAPRAVHLVNDTLARISGRVRVRLMDFLGGVSWEREIEVSVDANSAQTVVEIPRTDLGEFDGTRHVLVAEWLDAQGQVLTRDIHWYAEPKHLALPEQQLGMELHERAVTISARDLALYVEVDAGEGIPSDNFFHLLPGETRTVTIEGPISQVMVRSLADLLREA